MPHFHRKPDNGKHISSLKLSRRATILRRVAKEIAKNPKHEIEYERLSELYKGNTHSIINGLFSMFRQKIKFSILNVPDDIHRKISNTAKAEDTTSRSVPSLIYAKDIVPGSIPYVGTLQKKIIEHLKSSSDGKTITYRDAVNLANGSITLARTSVIQLWKKGVIIDISGFPVKKQRKTPHGKPLRGEKGRKITPDRKPSKYDLTEFETKSVQKRIRAYLNRRGEEESAIGGSIWAAYFRINITLEESKVSDVSERRKIMIEYLNRVYPIK